MNRKNMPNTLQVTPSPDMIKKVGGHLENAVNTAKQLAGALNDAAAQLNDVSKNIRKNAPAITAAATNFVQQNAGAAAPVIGNMNAAVISNLPSPVVNSYVKKAVMGGAEAVKNMSVTATNAAKAINDGLNQLHKGAAYVANNVNKVPVEKVNNMINVNGSDAMKAGARSLNSVANTRLPNLNLRSNLNKNHLNAVKNVANSVKNATVRNAMKTRRNRRR